LVFDLDPLLKNASRVPKCGTMYCRLTLVAMVTKIWDSALSNEIFNKLQILMKTVAKDWLQFMSFYLSYSA